VGHHLQALLLLGVVGCQRGSLLLLLGGLLTVGDLVVLLLLLLLAVCWRLVPVLQRWRWLPGAAPQWAQQMPAVLSTLQHLQRAGICGRGRDSKISKYITYMYLG
jgi:hypothetical protein